jgi:predicted Zn finger-like uncharacterized protein
LLTRCPSCETAFRVTPEQLKARQGKVRCGECQHVFNALESLVEEAKISLSPPVAEVAGATPGNDSDTDDQPVASTVPQEAPIAEQSAPVTATIGPQQNTAVDSESSKTPPIVDHDASPPHEVAMSADLAGVAGMVATTVTVEQSLSIPAEPQAPSLPASSPFPTPVDDPIALTQPPPPPSFEPLLHESPSVSISPAMRWLWFGGAGVAVLALTIQVLIHFRVELAVHTPSLRPVLEALCRPVGCSVDLPSLVDLMTIESSDLQPDGDRKNVLMLTATLRNRAPFAQQFPHLELSLTDAADKAIARRVLTPVDYLVADVTPEGVRSKDTFVSKGLPTGEFSLKLPIDGSQTAASGYRLYLFYP